MVGLGWVPLVPPVTHKDTHTGRTPGAEMEFSCFYWRVIDLQPSEKTGKNGSLLLKVQSVHASIGTDSGNF